LYRLLIKNGCGKEFKRTNDSAPDGCQPQNYQSPIPFPQKPLPLTQTVLQCFEIARNYAKKAQCYEKLFFNRIDFDIYLHWL
jgi:hypothetical protein